MNTAHPDFDQLHHANPDERAIVIGSGFGGLASAIRLAARDITSPCSRNSTLLAAVDTPIDKTDLRLTVAQQSSLFPSFLKNFGHFAAKP